MKRRWIQQIHTWWKPTTVQRWFPLIVILTILGAAGCKMTLPLPAEPTVEPASAAEVEATPTLTPSPEELDPSGQTLQLWHSLAGDTGKALDEITAQFNAGNEWNITVEPEYIRDEEELQRRLLAAVQAGDPPALFIGSRDVYRSVFEADALASMEAVVEGETWGVPAETLNDLHLNLFPDGYIANEQGYVSVPLGSRIFVLLYNTSELRQVGAIEPPATLLDFERNCKAFLMLRGRPCFTFTPRAEAVLNLTWMFDGTLFTDDQSLAVDNEGLHRALALLRALADNGLVLATTDEETSMESTITGDTLFGIASTAELPPAGDWDIAPLPNVNDTPAMAASGALFSVLDRTPQQQLAAWLFIRWYITSPEVQTKIALAHGFVPVHSEAVVMLREQDELPPALQQALDWIQYSRALPTSPAWFEIAPTLEQVAIDLLNRKIGPEEALEQLAAEQ